MGNMVGTIMVMVRFMCINVILLLRADILVSRRRFTENGENEPLKFVIALPSSPRSVKLDDLFDPEKTKSGQHGWHDHGHGQIHVYQCYFASSSRHPRLSSSFY